MHLNEYFEYLINEKQMSENTIEAYRLDLNEFQSIMTEKGQSNILDAKSTDVISYLLKLKNDGKSAATINRKIASLRAYYNYLHNVGVINENPTDGIRSPRVERKELEYLTIEEVDKFLSVPDESNKGKRDKAILELLYATGIRVSELVDVKLDDVNLRMGFISCTGPHSKARIIPIGRPARVAVEEYIYDIRAKFVRDQNKDEEALFVNYYGNKLTRQGLWKILKEYADKAGIAHKITPQTLRNSFAVHMIQNGADIKSLQELLGHEDITATQIYLTVTKNRIKDVYDRTHPRA